MGNFFKLFLVIVFNIVAVAMVINVDDIRAKFGIIILQVLFLCYQNIPHRE
jgi:hypothetical protein